MDKFQLNVSAYDIDFNITNTPHKIIHLDEKKGDIWMPTSVRLDAFEKEYKQLLGSTHRFRNDDIYQAYIEQSDNGMYGKLALLYDLRENDHGPSMNNRKKKIKKADPISIITARESSESALQESIYTRLCDELNNDQKKTLQEHAIYKYTRAKKGDDILKQYIGHVHCYAMYNKELAKMLGFDVKGTGNTPERKSIAVLHDIHCFDRNEFGIREELWKNMNLPKEYGFSDDEHINISKIADRILTEKSVGGLQDRKFTFFHTDKHYPSKISIRNN